MRTIGHILGNQSQFTGGGIIFRLILLQVYESPVSHFCRPCQDFLAGFFGKDPGVVQRL